jgi:glycosyltransferase involved in cell wall biosynthesis
MKVLGLTFVRNAETWLQESLDSMASYCDEICAVDDRSTDRTNEILRKHQNVSNVFTIDRRISDAPWHFPESWLLNLLYRMADFHEPDWVVILSADERIQPADSIRGSLAEAPPQIGSLQMFLASIWNDHLYPHMVPVMGQARSLVTRIWRYHPGLQAGAKRLHNNYAPVNLIDHGQTEFLSGAVIEHSGWSTLAERIAKVDLYTALDPNLELNNGIPYDLGLLFGFERHRVDALVQEYQRRIAQIRAV